MIKPFFSGVHACVLGADTLANWCKVLYCINDMFDNVYHLCNSGKYVFSST